jgi:hypothetical protein
VAGSNGQWRCSGASIVGRSHEREGLGCQDAWSIDHFHGDSGHVLAACVCDGAGSAKSAQAGAQLVSSAISHWMSRHFEKAIAEPAEALWEAVFGIREELRQRAALSQGKLTDYACTLVAVAVREGGQWVSWHLGDGGIIAQFGGDTRVLSTPKKGDFANVTQFVTDADVYTQVECDSSIRNHEVSAPQGFALFTDGIETSLFERKTGLVAPALIKMLGWHEQADEEQVAKAIWQSLHDVFRGLTGDDCTLVLMRSVVKPERKMEAQPAAGQSP